MERWKSVVGFEGLYEVSDQGKVRSLCYRKREGLARLLKVQYGTKTKVPVVTLRKNGKIRQVYVSRLVAEAFVPNPNNYQFVKAKDGNVRVTNASNLYWAKTIHG